MSNYKPRFLIQVDSIKGDTNSPRKDRYAYDEYEDAVIDLNQIDRYENAYLKDRARVVEGLPGMSAYNQGYYGLAFTGTLEYLEYFTDGLIDRLGDKALDNLDRVWAEKALEHEEKIKRRDGDNVLRNAQHLLRELRGAA